MSFNINIKMKSYIMIIPLVLTGLITGVNAQNNRSYMESRKVVSKRPVQPWKQPISPLLKAHIEQKSKEAFDKGERLYLAGHYDQAYRQWQTLAKQYPNTQGEALCHRCTAQYWKNIKGQPQVALKEYDKAIAIDPDGQIGRDAMFGKAHALYQLGDYKSSFKLLSQLRKMHISGELGENIDEWYQLAFAKYGERVRWQARGIKIADSTNSNCGPIALSIVCNRMGVKTDRNEIRQISHMNPNGASLLDLKRAAITLGCKADGLMVNPAGLQQIKKPVVAWVAGDHFVAVVHTDKKGVDYIDGDLGKIHLDWDQFGMIWRGAILVIDASTSNRNNLLAHR